MGRIVITILLCSISLSSFSSELADVKRDLNTSNRQMLLFIENAYRLFSNDKEVQLCANKMRKREPLSTEAVYSVLMYKLYNDITKNGSRLEKLKANKKLIKITPYYINSLSYCNS